jgi:hypothetical protein
MSRWALVIATCVAVAGRASAAPAGLTISASDTKAARGLRAGTADVISHDLTARLASTQCNGCHVDASVTRLVVETTRDGTAVTAEINVAVTDERGVMISVISGSARATARRPKLVSLRDEALLGAVEGVSSKVARALHQPALRPVRATAIARR